MYNNCVSKTTFEFQTQIKLTYQLKKYVKLSYRPLEYLKIQKSNFGFLDQNK